MTSLDNLVPSDFDQLHGLPLSRLKAHSRTSRNVQVRPISQYTIKQECRIRLGKVEVRADLDWPVSLILDFDEPSLTGGKEFDLVATADYCAR